MINWAWFGWWRSWIAMNWPHPFTFVKSVFSEADGSGSFARVASGACLVASIAWVSHIVHTTHALPPLDGVIAWNTSLYATNKLPTILKGKD